MSEETTKCSTVYACISHFSMYSIDIQIYDDIENVYQKAPTTVFSTLFFMTKIGYKQYTCKHFLKNFYQQRKKIPILPHHRYHQRILKVILPHYRIKQENLRVKEELFRVYLQYIGIKLQYIDIKLQYIGDGYRYADCLLRQ